MKRLWLTIAALSVLLVWPASAQDSWTTKAKISVPFSFVVNGTTLPAGDYRVMMYQGTSLLIQNADKPDNRMLAQNTDVLLIPGTTQKDTKLIFLLTDGQHVLHQVAVAGDSHIHDLIHGSEVVELVANR